MQRQEREEYRLESANWTWGLSLIALTIAVHAVGIVLIALAFVEIRIGIGNRDLHLRQAIPLVIGLVGTTGLLLAVLHGIEAAIWAAAYLWIGALDAPLDAILYSVDSMATRGASPSSACALRAEAMAISASSSAVGSALTAQSAKMNGRGPFSRKSGTTMRK